MRLHIVRQTGFVASHAERAAQGGCRPVVGTPLVGKKPRGMTMGQPEFSHGVQQGGRKRNNPLLIALANDAQAHLLGVDLFYGK